jgi:hypothetical protein
VAFAVEFCQLALPRPAPIVRFAPEILTKLLQEAVNLSVASQVETPPCDRKIDQGRRPQRHHLDKLTGYLVDELDLLSS